MQIVGSGFTNSKATAVLATVTPFDTQQLGVDNSVIPNMRCAVGVTTNKAAAQVVL